MPVIQSIPQTYCRTCHLATRMDVARCLHCNQLLAPPAAIKKPAPKRAIPARSARFALKLKVKPKREQGRAAHTGKSRHR